VTSGIDEGGASNNKINIIQRDKPKPGLFFILAALTQMTASYVQWSKFLATISEVPGSISGVT
jgi:hypothetical protein